MIVFSLIDNRIIKKKPLIYRKSLSCYETVCPWCHCTNPDSNNKRSALYSRENVGLPLDICPSCGNPYDMENVVEKKSKDYMECKALGLKGAVAKNEKGEWVQA